MSEVTRDGESHIKRWRDAEQGVTFARTELNRTQTELANAVNALGKWMLPADAKDSEKFCVWHGDSLIQVERKKVGMHDYEIVVRTRGESWNR